MVAVLEGANVARSALNNMPPMRSRGFAVAVACLLSASALLTGCGSGSGSSTPSSVVSTSAKSRGAPPRAEFPSAAGMTLEEVLNRQDVAPGW